MTQNTKLALYGGGVILVSVIAFVVYNKQKNKLPLVDGARVTEDAETPIPEGTKTNPFTAYVKNPLPSSIDFKPRDLQHYLKVMFYK